MIELEVSSETEKCAWGCGKPAKFYSDGSHNPRWLCSRSWQGCPAMIEKGRAKYTATMMEHYGVPVPTKNPAVDAKRRKTNLKRYKAEQVMQSKQVQRKYKKTLKTRHGVTHISQIPGVLEKANLARMKDGIQEKATAKGDRDDPRRGRRLQQHLGNHHRHAGHRDGCSD